MQARRAKLPRLAIFYLIAFGPAVDRPYDREINLKEDKRNTKHGSDS